MPSLSRAARNVLQILPASVQQPLRRLARAARSGATPLTAVQETELESWSRAFREIFEIAPSPEHLKRLAWLASAGSQLTPRQRYRSVLAAFDQQELHTGFAVRWGRSDVQLQKVHGFSMYLDRADISVAQVIAAGAYEPHLVAFFKTFLKPGMHVVDVGANIGLYTLLSAHAVGAGGKVWSFEPNSENCRLVLASAAENGFGNVELFPVALGNTRGYTYFTSALGSNGGIQEDAKHDLLDASCRIVPLARLDDHAIERAELMKMDVEGAEALLVQGAVETLRRCRPVIVCEFSHEMLNRISGWSGGRFIAFIEELGYTSFLCDKDTNLLKRLDDSQQFAAGFVGTGRIEDLVFCPAEKQASLPMLASS